VELCDARYRGRGGDVYSGNPADALVAVTFAAPPEGALVGENAFGIAWKPGEARAVRSNCCQR
jgi:hypothetical protein